MFKHNILTKVLTIIFGFVSLRYSYILFFGSFIIMAGLGGADAIVIYIGSIFLILAYLAYAIIISNFILNKRLGGYIKSFVYFCFIPAVLLVINISIIKHISSKKTDTENKLYKDQQAEIKENIYKIVEFKPIWSVHKRLENNNNGDTNINNVYSISFNIPFDVNPSNTKLVSSITSQTFEQYFDVWIKKEGQMYRFYNPEYYTHDCSFGSQWASFENNTAAFLLSNDSESNHTLILKQMYRGPNCELNDVDFLIGGTLYITRSSSQPFSEDDVLQSYSIDYIE